MINSYFYCQIYNPLYYADKFLADSMPPAKTPTPNEGHAHATWPPEVSWPGLAQADSLDRAAS